MTYEEICGDAQWDAGLLMRVLRTDGAQHQLLHHHLVHLSVLHHHHLHELCGENRGGGYKANFTKFRYFTQTHVWYWKSCLHLTSVATAPQLSCCDTCQLWMWFKESNGYYCKIQIFAYGEVNKQSLSNPHRSVVIKTRRPRYFVRYILYVCA